MPTIVLLAILRKKCNLTQEQLAKLSDRSQQLRRLKTSLSPVNLNVVKS
ncbi:MAG: hypothetical protein J7647_07410 [Cyanobacteria bacterium SBLK]|nr:hypothetical protein [Cyanobacteria bacterium SBLK]